MTKKLISIILSLVLCASCFCMVSTAASNDVKLIRRLNSNFSMSECYDQGFWKAYALADSNGKPYYFENNPINENGVYRAVEKNPDKKGEWYADLSGRGTYDKKNGIGESFDSDYPLSWEYSQLHIALRYTGRFYNPDGTTFTSSSLNNLVSLGDTDEVIFMNHNLVFPVEFTNSDIPSYTVEEVCADTISLYAGDTADVYFEDANGKTVKVTSSSIDDTPVASFSGNKLTAAGAGETTLHIKYTANNKTVEKTFRVIVKTASDSSSTGFRCSKCDWKDQMMAKGGISAMIARIIHPLFHTLERLMKRF